MIVTLIGYRGSGKSSVAAPLAERLGCACVDADAEIERRAGRSIRAIFDESGEPAFRRLEKEVLAELLARKGLVIAAGGGAVLDEETRQAMQAAGPVVWLRAPATVLAERIAGDATTSGRRPDLTDRGGPAEITELLAARMPLYEACATHIVETHDRSLEAIVDEIVQRLGKGGPR
jgi:shikimate kinase